MKTEISDAVKEKLSEAVKLWADDNLEGRPALLANCMYYNLVAAMEKNIREIDKSFGGK